MKVEPKKHIVKYFSKTKTFALRTAEFVWSGLFDTELQRTIEPGHKEPLRSDEKSLRFNNLPPVL
jgi:hypothetical protein